MSRTQHMEKAVEKIVDNLRFRGLENVIGINTPDGVIIEAEKGKETDIMEAVEKELIDGGVMDVDDGKF